MSSFFRESAEKKGHGFNPRHHFTGDARLPLPVRKASDAIGFEEDFFGPEPTFVFNNRPFRPAPSVKGIVVTHSNNGVIRNYTI